jgi:hypothetical protein
MTILEFIKQTMAQNDLVPVDESGLIYCAKENAEETRKWILANERHNRI